MRKLGLILFLFHLLLSGCSDGQKNNDSLTAGTTSSGKDLPVIENGEITLGLKGSDANGNGIRDDIDRLSANMPASDRTLKKVNKDSSIPASIY